MKCKDLVGRRVKLTRAIETGTRKYRKGTVLTVHGTWRGLFNLDHPGGGYIRLVDRRAFTELP